MTLRCSAYASSLAVIAAFFIFSLAVAPCDAVIIQHNKSDADALKLGLRFAAAGTVIPDGGCTLIHPRWVATAAHVAHMLKTGKHKVRIADQEYGIDLIVVHPDGQPMPNRPPEVDLALMRLAKEVDEAVKPVLLYRKTDEENKTVIVVGSGDVGDGLSRPKRSDGKRRAATNVVERVDENRIFIDFDEPPAGTKLEGVGGPGDSGGPLFLEVDDQTYLVGVSSGSIGREGRYGLTDVYTRVSTWAKWIDETIAKSP